MRPSETNWSILASRNVGNYLLTAKGKTVYIEYVFCFLFVFFKIRDNKYSCASSKENISEVEASHVLVNMAL